MREKSNPNMRKTTANPLRVLGVTVESADARCAIREPFNNEFREKAITISKGPIGTGRLIPGSFVEGAALGTIAFLS